MQISMLARRMRNAILRIWPKLFPFHSAAWDIAYQSVSEMVNAPGGGEQARLCRQWREITLSQLSYVALIVGPRKLTANDMLSELLLRAR